MFIKTRWYCANQLGMVSLGIFVIEQRFTGGLFSTLLLTSETHRFERAFVAQRCFAADRAAVVVYQCMKFIEQWSPWRQCTGE